MTTKEFISNYQGKTKGYPDGQFVGECLSLVKLYIKECYEISPPPSGTNSAYGYWSNFPNPLGTKFKKVESTPTNFPLFGDIVIWKPWTGNTYGHIDICIDENATKDKFDGLDQNWGTKIATKITHNYDNVIGWLTPISINNSDNSNNDMTDEQTRIFKFLEENNSSSEGKVREAIAALQEKPDYIKSIDDLKTKLKSLTDNQEENDKKIEELLKKIEQISSINTDIQNLATDWQSKWSTANEQLVKKSQELADSELKVLDLNKKITEMVKADESEMTLRELFELLISKLFKKQ